MKKEITVDDVFNYLGAFAIPQAEFAALLGKKASILHHWKKQGSIPEKYHEQISDIMNQTDQYAIDTHLTDFISELCLAFEAKRRLTINPNINLAEFDQFHSFMRSGKELEESVSNVMANETLWNALLHIIPKLLEREERIESALKKRKDDSFLYVVEDEDIPF